MTFLYRVGINYGEERWGRKRFGITRDCLIIKTPPILVGASCRDDWDLIGRLFIYREGHYIFTLSGFISWSKINHVNGVIGRETDAQEKNPESTICPPEVSRTLEKDGEVGSGTRRDYMDSTREIIY